MKIHNSGEIFGYLTIIKYFDTLKNRARYLCLCKCGNEKVVSGIHLRAKSVKSCGCLVKENNSLRKKPNFYAIKKKLYRSYIKGAKKRNLVFELSYETFCLLITSNCYYCNNSPSNKEKEMLYNGIDRKDNLKGYLEDNCVSCCFKCNYAKSDRPLEEFKDWIHRIYHRMF